jgi:hypothetical protein
MRGVPLAFQLPAFAAARMRGFRSRARAWNRALGRAAGALAISTLWHVASSAHAQPAWDGLERLVALADSAHIELSAPRALSLSQVSGRDALLLVNPQRPLPVGALSTFLREGGRIALLDDFGSGGRFLSAYQVERLPAPQQGPALRGDPRWLIAYPRSDHPLAEGVPLLLTNEASVLRHPDLKPVFVFGRGDRALALAGAVGAGRLVAVGDASLLINQLLSLPAHERFARNLLEYLSVSGGRIWLVGPNTSLSGSYGERDKHGMAWLDTWFKRVARPDLPPGVLMLIAFALTTIAVLVAANALPRKSPYLRAALFPDDTVYAGFAGRVALSKQPGSNLLWPLLDLKQELEAELAHLLGLSGGFDADRAAREAGRRGVSEQRVKTLLAQLSELARRAENESEKTLVTAAELSLMVREAEQLLSQLGSERT